jgi:transcriptional regulator with XRE-family HTH domain
MNNFLIKFQVTDSFSRAFQHLICEERKKRNLSQFELAWKSGLSRQCLSFFESGRRIPTLSSMYALAKGLDMPLMKFVSMLLSKVDFYERHGRMPLAADRKKPKWKV